MSDAAAEETDVRRIVRAVFPVRAKQPHAIPERPYTPRGPWAPDANKHLRVLREDPEDELLGATAQNNYTELPYRCRLCGLGLTDDGIEEHQCQS